MSRFVISQISDKISKINLDFEIATLSMMGELFYSNICDSADKLYQKYKKCMKSELPTREKRTVLYKMLNAIESASRGCQALYGEKNKETLSRDTYTINTLSTAIAKFTPKEVLQQADIKTSFNYISYLAKEEGNSLIHSETITTKTLNSKIKEIEKSYKRITKESL